MIAIDTGGTFTDFVRLGREGIRVHKEPSTPDDPARSILRGLAAIDPDAREPVVVYGTTLATNALLERKGAPTAVLTTAGLEDLLEIGRQARPGLYDLHPRKPASLVPVRLRLGVRERITADGRVAVPLRPAEVARALRLARARGARSIAVCFVNAFAEPRHERLALRLAVRAGFAACASHQVGNEFREYERFTATAINAMTSPLLDGFLRRLQRELRGRRLWVIQSDGGMIPPALAGKLAVRTILSGPAGGVTGLVRAGRRAGRPRLIGLDIGGTSTDVALSTGSIPLMREGTFDGFPVRLPMVDVRSVGAGGGSIARMGQDGRLRVGPESAGADPGPVCCGRGRELTVTDANLFLGRIDPRGWLGGERPLDLERTRTAMRAFARRLRLSPEAAAEGIVRLANAHMESAIRAVSIECGHDPRGFALLAFGGGGGLHACALAEALGIGTVLVPPHPGVFSAYGMLFAPVSRTHAATVLRPWSADLPRACEGRFRALEGAARRELGPGLRCERTADLRYVGQAFELTVPFGPGAERAFQRAHRLAYGYADPARPVEVVTLRLRASRPVSQRSTGRGLARAGDHAAERGRLFERGRWRHAVRMARECVGRRGAVAGPAILLEYGATTYLPAGWRATRDRLGNLLLSRGTRQRPARARV